MSKRIKRYKRYLFLKKSRKHLSSRLKPGENYKVLVRYTKGRSNESAWYKTKKEVMYAYRCFTEKDLLVDLMED